MLISETWLHRDIPDSLIDIQNYTVHRQDRVNRKGGGVIIYVRDFLLNYRIQVLNIGNTQPPEDIEAIVLNIQISTYRFCLVCVYRPPGVSLVRDRELIDYLTQLTIRNENIIILGDFNYPLINWSTLTLSQFDQASEMFIDFYKNTGLKQIVDFKTRFRNGQSSMLDLLFTGDKKLFASVSSHPPVGISDHVVIHAVAQVKLNAQHTRRVEKRNFWKADYEAINEQISQTGFTESLDNLIDAVSGIITRNIPLRKVTTNSQKPWINEMTFKKIKRKRQLWDKYKRVNTEEAYQEYRRHSNELKNHLKEAQKRYEVGLLDRADKYFFSYIKRAINSNTTSITLKNKDNIVITDLKETAENLALQFEKVFTTETMSNFPSLPVNTRSVNEIRTVKFSPEIMNEVLKEVKRDASPGPDLIPAVFLSRCADTLSEPLSKAMNYSLQNGIFPEIWSRAIVTPLFKKGDKYNPENYRPISLTCALCKTMEKPIVRELTSFLLDNNVIPNSQHGFLPQRSTVTNLLSCLNKWTQDVDGGRPVDVVYLDYEKAFDTVPIERLLYKLDHFGVRGELLQWIACFLRNRTYVVRANSTLSSGHNVRSGVPQGSVLGPLLFVTYISDVSSGVRSSVAYFADDTKLFGNPIQHQIEEDLRVIHEWTRKWMLRLNLDKCTVLHLGKDNPHVQYRLENFLIRDVNQQKDLGVLVSDDLKWEPHIASIVKKANTLIYLIQRAFCNTSVEMVSKLYKTYVRPKIEYACSVWSPFFVKDIEILERVQRRMTRISDETRHLTYPERLKAFKISSLKERRERGDMIQVFKTLSGYYSPLVELSLFHLNERRELRGHSRKINKERCQLLIRKNFITNRVVYKWNSLEEETVTAPSINAFKNRLDRELQTLNNQFIHYI